MVVQYFV